jgi:hypothetical protein
MISNKAYEDVSETHGKIITCNSIQAQDYSNEDVLQLFCFGYKDPINSIPAIYKFKFKHVAATPNRIEFYDYQMVEFPSTNQYNFINSAIMLSYHKHNYGNAPYDTELIVAG